LTLFMGSARSRTGAATVCRDGNGDIPDFQQMGTGFGFTRVSGCA
jgi:hypothetical protein